MTKTEVLQFIGKKSWMSDQAGIPSMYVSDVTELLMKIEASRDSRMLSAVPSGQESNDALNNYVGFIASIPEIQDLKRGWRECYNWMIRELKQRGIDG